MKKIFCAVLALFIGINAVFAQETVTINQLDAQTSKAIKIKKVDGVKGVTVIKGKKFQGKDIASVNLEQFVNKEIKIDFGCQIKIVSKSKPDYKISWLVNDFQAGFPVIAEKRVKTGEWTTLTGSKYVSLSGKRMLLLSTNGFDLESMTIYIKDVSVRITGDDLSGKQPELTPWMEAQSLKDVLHPYFDYFGIATTWQGEFNTEKIQKGLGRHCDSITTGNEFKPDFIFRWNTPTSFNEFVSEKGKKIKVPVKTPGLDICGQIMQTAKDNGLEMRGHVLVWHSQTPKWFFMENYSTDSNAKYVDKATMNARMEWYIKTMMDYVAKWEKENNGGKHIIKTWDVVNEAMSDSATESKWLREDSDWYKIYQSEEFIINAFRYANKYAPKDVKLAYNDYNSYQGSANKSGGKTNAILKIVDLIQKTPDARIDVVGMQSHVQIGYPNVTGTDSFETAVQRFIEKGVNVQVTELDIANGDSMYSSIRLKDKYKEYFEMFIRNRKTDTKKGIEGVTIWGITDDGTWLNALQMYKGKKQYPLLFTGDFKCKPAFFGIIEAAQEAEK